MTFRELVAEVVRRSPPGVHVSVSVECNRYSIGSDLQLVWRIYRGDAVSSFSEGATPEEVLAKAFPADAHLDVVDADQLMPPRGAMPEKPEATPVESEDFPF